MAAPQQATGGSDGARPWCSGVWASEALGGQLSEQVGVVNKEGVCWGGM